MERKESRLIAILLVICMIGSLAIPALAATVDEAIIHSDRKGSINIYAYDWTNAAKDGKWSQTSYTATGQFDSNVNAYLGGAIREGDTDNESTQGNSSISYGYALAGVEFTYLKVADFYQYTGVSEDGKTGIVELLYKFDKEVAADLLAALGLTDGLNSYAAANALDDTAWFYQSNVLNTSLKAALETNATTVKNALEAYVVTNGTAMPLTDGYGYTGANELPLGLYLLAQTACSEGITVTTDPFFVSLPSTAVNGGGDGSEGNDTQFANGGHEWLYDVTVYPKSSTGIVILEKTVREALKDTGKHNGSGLISDGYAHNATASAGDTVEYQIISTLPTITSAATYIAEYTFQDVLSRGLRYDETTPVVIEWYTDKACTDLVTTWALEDGKFSVARILNTDGTHTMTVSMTEAGLAEINTANTSAENTNGGLYAGYSNYTIRIKYNAILNSDESLVYGDAGNPNEVVLTWRRTSSEYYDTLIDDCHIYVYAANLTKLLSNGKTDQALFDEILFTVQNETDGYYLITELNEDEGVWYVTGYTTDKAEATAMHPVDWNGKKGQLTIKGIEDDDYIITEIETADGYTLLAAPIYFGISVTDDADRPCGIYTEETLGLIQNDSRFNFDGGLDLHLANIPQAALAHNMLTASATFNGKAIVMLNDDVDAESTNAIAPFEVTNDYNFIQPPTGETTQKWIPIVGGGLIALAIFGLALWIILPKLRKTEQ